MDEDGLLRQRGAEIFEYNSKGDIQLLLKWARNKLFFSLITLTTQLKHLTTKVWFSNLLLFALGLLTRVYSKAASWTITYRYDGLGRRVASKNSLGQHLQFFYADLNYPTRITHVYNHSSSEITSFYYDLQV